MVDHSHYTHLHSRGVAHSTVNQQKEQQKQQKMPWTFADGAKTKN